MRFYVDTLEMVVAYRSDEGGWAQMATGEGQLAAVGVDVLIKPFQGRWGQ